jgi:hypothetical protein
MKIILFFTALDCEEQEINIENWISITIDEQRHIFINNETPPYDWNYLRGPLSASGLEFYIAFHGTSMREISQIIINDIQTEFPGSRISYKFYSHSDRDLIWSSFCNLIGSNNPASKITKFDNLVRYIQIPWDLEYFLELLHLLVNVPEEEKDNRMNKAFELMLNLKKIGIPDEIINILHNILSEIEKMKGEEINILNSNYLKHYKKIYTTLRSCVREEE